MYVEPPISTGLRWAAYAAAFALVAPIGVRVVSAPKTPFQELRARVDTGWKGTYFDETPVPTEAPADEAAESDATMPALARFRANTPYGTCEHAAWQPFNVLSVALLSFLVLGIVGWLGAVFADARPFRRRPRQVESAHA